MELDIGGALDLHDGIGKNSIFGVLLPNYCGLLFHISALELFETVSECTGDDLLQRSPPWLAIAVVKLNDGFEAASNLAVTGSVEVEVKPSWCGFAYHTVLYDWKII